MTTLCECCVRLLENFNFVNIKHEITTEGQLYAEKLDFE